MAFALVTVIIVIWSSLYWMSSVHYGNLWTPPEPDLFEGAYITDDVTFTGLSGELVNRVHVLPGGSLRIVECDLTVPLEELVTSQSPLFEIASGGALDLVGTTIRVVSDPNLTKAVFRGRSTWGSAHGLPILARAVNLKDAGRPLLSLNVSWSQEATELLVTVQRAPGTPFDRLGSMRLPQMRPGQWTHLELDLSAGRGSIVWLALSPIAWDWHSLLVSDLRVTDGGLPLKGDRFATGDPAEDGWFLQGFESFQQLLRGQYWGGIVVSQGKLTITSSSIQMPAGVPRLMQASIDNGDPVVDAGVEGSNLNIAPRNGEIAIWNGSMEMANSSLVNVPVTCDDSTIALADSTLAGDVDQLTVLRSGGILERTALVSKEPPPGTPTARAFAGNYRWALSVDRAMGGVPLELRGCRFEGGEVAIDLDGADARISGCEFRNVSRLAIWDHEAMGLGGWDAVRSSNSFIDCTGHRYLRTEGCELDFVGPDAPSPEDAYGYTQARVVGPEAPILPDLRLVYAGALNASVMLPSLSIEGDGTVHAIEELRLAISTPWDGDVETAVAAGTKRAEVVFNGTDDDHETLEEYLAEAYLVSWDAKPGRSPGELAVGISLDWEHLFDRYQVEILRIKLFLDGDILEEIDVNRTTLNTSIPLDIGPHEVMIVLNCTRQGWDAPRDLWNRTWHYLRVDAATTSAEAFAFLNGTGGVLLLDPGTDILLDDPAPRHTSWGGEWNLGVLSWGDTTVTTRGFEGNGTTWFGVSASGGCAVRVEDVTCGCASFGVRDSSISVSRLECASLDPYGEGGGSLHIDNATVNGSIFAYGFEGANLALEDSHVRLMASDFSPPMVYLEATDSIINIVDTTFDSDITNEAYVEAMEWSKLQIKGCTFDGVSLHLPKWYGWSDIDAAETVSFDVQDNLFNGSGSYLVTETYNKNVNDSLLGTIDGNIFSGTDSGLIVPWNEAPLILEENVFRDGARAFQSFGVDVTAISGAGEGQRTAIAEAILDGEVRPRAPEDIYFRTFVSMAHFVDVTSDPRNETRFAFTMMFTVDIDDYWAPNPVVVWFEDVSVREMPLDITVPGVPGIEDLIWPIISPLLGPRHW